MSTSSGADPVPAPPSHSFVPTLKFHDRATSELEPWQEWCPNYCANRVQALTTLKFLPRPWFEAACTILPFEKSSILISIVRNWCMGGGMRDYAYNRLSFSDLRYIKYRPKWYGKHVKKPQFFPIFHKASMYFHPIANWRTQGEPTRNTASDSHKSPPGTRSSQIIT